MPATGRATGIVIAVDEPSITTVNSFTLRTDAGAELVFGIGSLDLSDGDSTPGICASTWRRAPIERGPYMITATPTRQIAAPRRS